MVQLGLRLLRGRAQVHLVLLGALVEHCVELKQVRKESGYRVAAPKSQPVPIVRRICDVGRERVQGCTPRVKKGKCDPVLDVQPLEPCGHP